MQPLQRSYSLTENRIDTMISSGALSTLYDEAKVEELENAEELSGKEKNKLDAFKQNKPIYEAILEALQNNVNETVYMNPTSFTPIIKNLIAPIVTDAKECKKIVEKIVKGLSVMDKNADIQKDKKGNILYDAETKDTEIVPYDVDIDDYMDKEVLPHVPDAKWFFEEDMSKKKPVIKTGAEIPFTRYFYKYQAPTPSEELMKQFVELETSVSERIQKLFGGM